MVLHFVSVLQRKYATFKTLDTEMRVDLAKRYLGRVLWFVSLPLTVPLAVFLRILLRLLKPFVHVRFGQLWSPRLGQFSLPTELYLCEKDAGIQPRHSLDIFYHYDRDVYILRNPVRPTEAICNNQLNIMWGRVFPIYEFARFLDRLNRMMPRGSDDFIARLGGSTDIHIRDLLHRFPPHLSFTGEEEERGIRGLRELGIEPDAPFVCFHARDPAYLDRARPRNVELYGDWSWQNYRDSSIGNYLLATEKLADFGYYVIRMGKFVQKPLDSQNPRVIDYASRFQSDFMDIFLSARCDFFIGQGSGITLLPVTFRRPVGFVNVVPLLDINDCHYDDCILIFKTFYSAERNRLLSFREMLDLGIGRYNGKDPRYAEIARKLGLEVRENSPEEIAEVAVEMHQRLHSVFSLSQEEEELQRRFMSMVESYPQLFPSKGIKHSRIGTHFLRTHRALLD